MSCMRRTARLIAIALVGAVACSDGDRFPDDAGPDSAVQPVPGCEGFGEPQPDLRCGPVPAEYRHGCGCTDGVPSAVCMSGRWTCPEELPPRTRCTECSGLSRPLNEREATFWKQVAFCGEPVEDYPTAAQMADAADAVAVGRFVGATAGNTVQGDAAEDFYAEANLQVEVVAALRHDLGQAFELSLTLTSVHTPNELEPALEALRSNLPRDPAVLFVRAREDFDDLYRLIGDKALWARTARAALDNPIAHDSCLGHYGDEVRTPFFGPLTSVDAVIEALRQ
jgi:hypothetical protein